MTPLLAKEYEVLEEDTQDLLDLSSCPEESVVKQNEDKLEDQAFNFVVVLFERESFGEEHFTNTLGGHFFDHTMLGVQAINDIFIKGFQLFAFAFHDNGIDQPLQNLDVTT